MSVGCNQSSRGSCDHLSAGIVKHTCLHAHVHVDSDLRKSNSNTQNGPRKGGAAALRGAAPHLGGRREAPPPFRVLLLLYANKYLHVHEHVNM